MQTGCGWPGDDQFRLTTQTVQPHVKRREHEHLRRAARRTRQTAKFSFNFGCQHVGDDAASIVAWRRSRVVRRQRQAWQLLPARLLPEGFEHRAALLYPLALRLAQLRVPRLEFGQGYVLLARSEGDVSGAQLLPKDVERPTVDHER